MLRIFEGYGVGISIGGITHTDEAYADDVGLITDNTAQINYILELLRVNSEVFGLTINIKKTNAMVIGAATNVPPCII